MTTSFQFNAIPHSAFEAHKQLDNNALEEMHGKWVVAESENGYPCRVSLEDAAVGDRVLVISFTHHDVNSPYRASGPIFVREKAVTASVPHNVVPAYLMGRLLSVRAYDHDGLMVVSDVSPGEELDSMVLQCFKNKRVAYLHVHNARYGCYMCSVSRV